MAAVLGRVLVALGLGLAVAVVTPSPARAAEPDVAYPATGLAEVSGMATSVLHPGVVWLVEDSGDPITRAYDPTGAEVGSVTLAGWNNRDTEAVAMGPGPTLWVADIGDNLAVRESVVVHTFPEPAELGATTVEPVSYRVRFPDGPRDAETVLVDPVGGRLYVATKSLLGSGGLYAAPTTLTPGATHDLEDVTGVPSLVNDGTFTADGRWLVLRRFTDLALDTEAVVLQPVRDESGTITELTEVLRIPLPEQEQGESIAVSTDGSRLLVGSEGATEPIWSVPLPAAVTPEPVAGSPSGTTGGSRSAPAPGFVTAEQCGITAVGACTGRPVVWAVGGAAALLALLVGAAVARRRHLRQMRSTM